MWPNHNFKKKLKFLFLNVWPNFDSETKSASNKFIISPTKTNLFLKEFTFNWPIIALFILSNLCFFILLMSLEETLSPITKRKLSLTLSLYSFQLKFVRKVSKFLRSKERPVLFITVSNYCYLFSSHTSSRWAFTSSVNVFFKSVSATNYTRNNDFITLCFHRFRQSYFFFRNIFRCLFNSIQDEPFRGCSRMGG